MFVDFKQQQDAAMRGFGQLLIVAVVVVICVCALASLSAIDRWSMSYEISQNVPVHDRTQTGQGRLGDATRLN